jgi:hypothetical protein
MTASPIVDFFYFILFLCWNIIFDPGNKIKKLQVFSNFFVYDEKFTTIKFKCLV